MLIPKKPCEVCGDEVIVDKKRRAYLCEKHRNIVRRELGGLRLTRTLTNRIRFYPRKVRP